MMNYTKLAALFTILGLTGCGQGSPGGPGVTDTTAQKPIYGQKDDTFNLSVPLMSSSLQQGATLETKVGIERATNFGEDVTLKFFRLPDGVTVSPSVPVIKHGDESVTLMFSADTTAVVGEYLVKVFGHPENGADAEVEFKLSIQPRDSFSLSVPRLSTSFRQSETKAVSIGINRDKTFTSDVVLQFAELPTGVTMEPASPVIKEGEAETAVTLTAAADAALGDFTVMITGHPATGLDATKELKLSIVQE